MDDQLTLAGRFEEHRGRLRSVAYRMLGSPLEADDAVQDTWIRFSRTGPGEVENPGGWLTTVVSRICLNMLRARTVRREDPSGVYLPDLVVVPAGELQPEQEAVLSDSVGLAMLVVLDTLSPAERLAFVLHDLFDVPFAEVAVVADRTPAAARQLASRARRRVAGAGVPTPDPDRARQRDVVDAFFTASRGGDFEALIAVLDPDVVLRPDWGAQRRAVSGLIRGAEAVSGQALMFSNTDARLLPVWVNGTAGVVVTLAGRAFAVMAFTVSGGRIVEINALADADRVRRVAAAVLQTGD